MKLKNPVIMEVQGRERVMRTTEAVTEAKMISGQITKESILGASELAVKRLGATNIQMLANTFDPKKKARRGKLRTGININLTNKAYTLINEAAHFNNTSVSDLLSDDIIEKYY